MEDYAALAAEDDGREKGERPMHPRKDYGGGEMYFDGKLVRKDGKFLPKSMAGLNA